jgi:hypothetical protein
MARSVLRLADQRRDVVPERCVLSGVKTTGAMRSNAVAWAGHRWILFVPGFAVVLAYVLRRPHADVAIPASPEVWTRWRRRVVLCQGAAVFGGVLIATGSVFGEAPPLAGGVIVFVGAIALWARANRNWWVTCVLDSAQATVIVEPTHQEFDREAREIFLRSIR